jgi:hypothetical protein
MTSRKKKKKKKSKFEGGSKHLNEEASKKDLGTLLGL